jgi:phage gpG-like protein
MSDDLLDPDAVHAALLGRVQALEAMLLLEVSENLDGRILHRRSGALAASVTASVDDEGDILSATIASSGVPYAAIQEYGGHTAAHEIVAVKGRVLAFVTGGATHFAARVQHPGSNIPARAPFGTALETCADAILSGLKESVASALQD